MATASTTSLEDAEAAYALFEESPVKAVRAARRSLERSRRERCPEAEVVALHALAVALFEVGDPRAIQSARAAVRVADREGLVLRGARARRVLAAIYAHRGSPRAALRELDAAMPAFDERERARSEVARLAVLMVIGGEAVSLDAALAAARTLGRAGDTVWEARLRGNLGLALVEHGRLAEAETELLRARSLYARNGADAGVRSADLARAWLCLLKGDLGACLRLVDELSGEDAPPREAAEALFIETQASVAAGLLDEARRAIVRLRALNRSRGVVEPWQQLELSRLALLSGDAALARQEAVRVR
ncbi:MAG: hypothetical protein FJ104_10565, partial [Deltaproteobacteria bacterium]|nr:hypothetical protein [Deltaproteobacteria bacterium]